MPSIAIQPIGPFEATLRPPGSKSLTNRAMLLAALAQGESRLRDPLWADDTQRMYDALRALGVRTRLSRDGRELSIHGSGPFHRVEGVALDLGNAGTALRPLTAACCLGAGRYRLDGDARMRQRPIGQLVDALRRLGAEIEYALEPGYPPLVVHGSGLGGGEIDLAPTLSSQYISALLMAAPCCRRGLTLRFHGPVTSRPYVRMTLAVMERFGVPAEVDAALTRATVAPAAYEPRDYPIEPDASNASYFLAAAAVVPGSQCTIQGLGRASIQGDAGFADVLHAMGAGRDGGADFVSVRSPPPGRRLQGIDIDLNDMPDMAQTLAVVALFADGGTTIRNVGNLRVKETDRLAALERELTRLGATVRVEGDDIAIQPPADHRLTPPPGGIDTYQDHRMAMSFAVAGLAAPGIAINDPACVNKTFPAFFEYLGRLGAP